LTDSFFQSTFSPMPESEKSLGNRLAVSFQLDDKELMQQLRPALEKKLAMKLAWSDIVRIALRKLAKAEGVHVR
jgi:hypothetical protein